MPLAAELPFAFYAIAALVFGLMVGSFLNVVIWRVPRGESIAFPGSHCGSCGTAVKPYDNIPLLSYAVLDGKCRHCKAKISWFYPAVELLTGLLFLAVVWKSGPTWVAIAEMIFVAVIVSLTFIDARHQLLPNVITYPAFLFSLCAAGLIASFPVEPGTLEAYLEPEAFPDNNLGKLIVVPLLLACALPIFWLIDRMDDVLFGKYFEPSETETFEPSAEELEIETRINARHQRVIQATMIIGVSLALTLALLALLPNTFLDYQFYSGVLHACLGALVGGGVIWLLRAAYFLARGFEGMGLGDVKLMAVIGAFLGWQQSILVIIIGSLAGSIVGLMMARKSKDGMQTALPFGVFLGPAALLALFFGHTLVEWYTSRLH